MDATTRWETEAMRGGPEKRTTPPKPSRQRSAAIFTDPKNWVSLREAEDATGIPVNTLRKWVRRADLPSYLEADGDLALRMVDLDAVVARARTLGREISEPSAASDREPLSDQHESETEISLETQESNPPEPPQDVPSDTMIVPIDAWNKMLNQLGNLHEAGQQLAEARERAGKAETEARFLREQLAEQRAAAPPASTPQAAAETINPEPEPQPVETTTYWQHLTTGWRSRKKH